MNKNRAKYRWVLDAGMYAGFILMFFLELTGVIVHQWLGLAVGVIALYHLLDHWDWVSAVSKRYFGKTSWQARLYYLVDAGILLGFLGILLSGLGISTWFAVLVDNQAGWIDFHVVVSSLTLVLLVVKVIAHRGWIVKTAEGWQKRTPVAQPMRPLSQPVKETGRMDRRDFLKLAGVVSAAAAVALLNIADSVADAAGSDEAQTATGPVSVDASSQAITTGDVVFYEEESSETESTASEQPSIPAYCRTCRKGKHCSFPGDCRDYVDSDGNGLCDLGECA